jgi:protein tyrosine phosphatase
MKLIGAQDYAKAYQYTLICGAPAFPPVFLHLAQASPSPILLHCTAGKNRTGVAAMLVLLLEGSDAAAIAKE